jgi:ABC-type transport system involved in multi-copper enzyme maturation permease subunit
MIDGVALAEMRRGARRWTTYVLRGVLLAVIGLVILSFQANIHPQTTSDYADLGRRLFRLFTPVHGLFVAVLAVLGACDAVSREARSGTLGLLIGTGLGGRSIATGKWIAVMAQAGTAVLAGAPILAVCAFLGGAGVIQVGGALAIPLSTAGTLAALALWASARMSAGWSAFMLTVLVVLLYTFVSIFLVSTFAFNGSRRGPEEWALFMAAAVHPLLALILLVEERSQAGQYAWMACALLLALCARGLLSAAGRRIEARAIEDPAPGWEPEAVNVAPRDVSSSRLGLFARVGEVWDRDPLLWKERRARPSALAGPTARLSLLWLFVLLLQISAFLHRRDRMGMALFWGAVLLPIVIASAAHAFASEREGRRWELLLSAPVSPFQVLRAKLIGRFIPADLLLVLVPAIPLVAAAQGLKEARDLLVCVAIVGAFLTTVFLIGTAASLASPTVRAAALWTIFLTAALALIGPMLNAATGRYRHPEAWPWVVESLSTPYRILRMLRKADPGAEMDQVLRLSRMYVGAHAALWAVLLAWMLARFPKLARC